MRAQRSRPLTLTWASLLSMGLMVLPLLLTACSDSSTDYYPPAAPATTTADAGDGVVVVGWSPSVGADSYNLYWGTAPDLSKALSARVGGIIDTEYTLTGLINGETYYFAVSAVNVVGEGALSKEISITLAPGAVEVITVSAGDARVTITWMGIFGATSYNLYRDTNPGVTQETGVPIENVVSPYTDMTVLNGVTYYYVLTAVGPGGEGPDSSQISAQPRAPLGGPENPAVTVVDESPNTLLISWDPPSVGNPDSYNIYWDTSPGVTVGTNPIVDVESPYLHTGLSGRVTHYYIVTAIEGGFESEPSAEVSGTPFGGPGGGGGHEGFGNNLSFPLLFADGYGVSGLEIDGTVEPWLDHATGLRPTPTDVLDPFPYFDPNTIVNLNGIDYYEQQSESTWQAGWLDGSAGMQDVILDWGDNLTSAPFTSHSVIRVETILYQDDPNDLLPGYEMALLYGSGPSEMQGTSGVTYDSGIRHVFAVNARLRIEKLDGPGGQVDLTVPGFDAAVYEGFGAEGPGAYGAEINVAGKLVFGYVWMLNQWPLPESDKVGWWRLTFSLDPQATFGNPGVTLDNNVTIVALDPSETVATLDLVENSSSIEVHIAN